MNFKDAYKSYNDEIKGDPKVLDAILNGKKENKKVFFIRHSYMGAIAAMVVIAVSAFGFGNFNKTSQSPQRTYIAANNSKQNKTDIVPNTRIIDGNTAGEIVTAPKEDTSLNSAITAPDSTVVQQTNEGEIASNSTVSENPLPAAEPDIEPMAVLEDEGEASAYDAPFTGRAIPTDENLQISDTVTTADCYAYFGFDVTEKAKLPADITFGGNVIINAEKSDQTGELEYCSFSIDAYSETNPQRILNVNVTKSNLSANNSDIEFFVSEQSHAVTGGAFTADGISVRVDSVGLLQNEVFDILNSLK